MALNQTSKFLHSKGNHKQDEKTTLRMETLDKMKIQPSEWEKIFANETTDKGLISKIYKQLMELNIKKNQKIQLKNGRKT